MILLISLRSLQPWIACKIAGVHYQPDNTSSILLASLFTICPQFHYLLICKGNVFTSSNAASVGSKPAMPTTAIRTKTISLSVTKSIKASLPLLTSIFGVVIYLIALSSFITTTLAGENIIICSSKASIF